MRKSNYSFNEKIKNIFGLIRTKLFFRNSRLIRFPIRIRGKKYIDFGSNLTTGINCRIDAIGEQSKKILFFGKNVNIGDNVRISCINKILISDNVLIGSGVLIIDNAHGNYSGINQDNPKIAPNSRRLTSKEIIIKKNVWIGEHSVVQKGVTIGEGSIVCANTVVTKNVPSNVIVGGIPAKIIKYYDNEKKEWLKKG